MASKNAEVAKNVAIAAAIVAALIAIVAALIAFHERHMRSVEEAFAASPASSQASLSNPASSLQARKTSAYLAVGIASFFSANTPADVAEASAKYHVFFAPTKADLQCDFTKSGQRCPAMIETLSCTDRTTNIPANFVEPSSQVNSISASEPVDTNDCRVSIFDNVYAFSKTPVMTRAFVYATPGQPRDGVPVILVLPRASFATRLIMLLRPVFVRCGNSRLYAVDYGAPGTDGMAYDSWERGENALLQLRPVMNPMIDQNTTPIAAVVNPPPSDPFSQPVGSSAKAAAGPAAAARELTIPRARARISLVCYYFNYAGPNPAIARGSSTPVATAYLRALPNSAQKVVDVDGKQVLSVSVGNALSPNLSISVAGQAFSMPALDGLGGVATVTATTDAIFASVSTPDRTSVRRFTLARTALKPYVPNPTSTGLESSPDLAAALGIYARSSTNVIPNMADVALRASALAPSALSVTAVQRAAGDTLASDVPLAAGQSLVSASGAFKAVFQLDCNLVIYNTQTGIAVWESGTASTDGSSAFRLTIGRQDGVLRAFNTSLKSNPSARPYWTSSATAGPPDQAPYTAKLTDAGTLVVTGALGASPVWASGKGNYGVAFLATCDAASAMYAVKNADAISQSGSPTPWAHYTKMGQLLGLVWPGPPC